MNLILKINEINEIHVGFDPNLAKEKFDKIESILTEIENTEFRKICEIPRADIIYFIEVCYGVIYEIDETRQTIDINDVGLAKRILPIARLIYGISKELLPFLYLNLHNSIQDKELYKSLQVEISQIS
jgi:hypothetical protein